MSAAVGRALRVLSFLGTHAGHAWNLSELCRQLDISKATGHAILAQLVEEGYVSHTDGSFSIGPALVPLGRAAEHEFPGAASAQAQIERLVDEFNVEAIVSVGTGHESLVVFHAGIPRPFGVTVEAGQRLPMLPPMGSVFMAWGTAEEVDTWLARLGPTATEEQKERFLAMLRVIRARGYVVAYLVNAFARLADLYTSGNYELNSRAVSGDVSHILADLGDQQYLDESDESATGRLANISAPVFDSSGRIVCSITLIPSAQYGTDDIPVLAEAAMRAADRIMRDINGRRPDVAHFVVTRAARLEEEQ